MARFFISKCKNPDCSVCHPKVTQMSGINHRLFSNNNSTATHWYPTYGEPIPINELSWNHLAAIVDLYEYEAVKFIEENFKPYLASSPDSSKRSSFITQSFLKKHVKAWPSILERRGELFRSNYSLYQKLFINKRYTISSIHKMNDEAFRGQIEFEMPKIEYKPIVYKPNATISVSPTERERIKGRIALKLSHIKTITEEIVDLLGKL